MRVAQIGTGQPEVAVVGAIHGDEPCGARAIERLLLERPDVLAPVKLVVANEAALERGVRYVDADLNRAFEDGGDPKDHEYGLARRLAEELAGCTALSIHATQSHPEPFGIVNGEAGTAADVVRRLPIETLVRVSTPEGRPFAIEATELLEVEAGYQHSATAARNAYRSIRAFLRATDVLPGTTRRRDVPVFDLGEPVAKPAASEYEVLVDNFDRVDAGDIYARAGETDLSADDPFYPVLFSAKGYRDIFGYAGDLLDG